MQSNWTWNAGREHASPFSQAKALRMAGRALEAMAQTNTLGTVSVVRLDEQVYIVSRHDGAVNDVTWYIREA